MRLTLPGDATAGRQMETVFSRHKFTDSSLLAVKAVRREEVLSPYIYILARIAATNQRRATCVMNLADSLPNVNPCSRRCDAPRIMVKMH